jgi:hypothetical protein
MNIGKYYVITIGSESVFVKIVEEDKWQYHTIVLFYVDGLEINWLNKKSYIAKKNSTLNKYKEISEYYIIEEIFGGDKK